MAFEQLLNDPISQLGYGLLVAGAPGGNIQQGLGATMGMMEKTQDRERQQKQDALTELLTAAKIQKAMQPEKPSYQFNPVTGELIAIDKTAGVARPVDYYGGGSMAEAPATGSQVPDYIPDTMGGAVPGGMALNPKLRQLQAEQSIKNSALAEKPMTPYELQQLQIKQAEEERAAEKAKDDADKKAREKAEAQSKLDFGISQAEKTLTDIDALVGSADGKIKPHSGFETSVGRKGSSYLFGLMDEPFAGTDAADFMGRYKQLKGKSFLAAFETLKGGGTITEVEGQKAEAAMNRMDTAQRESDFIAAARDFQDAVRIGIEKLKAQGGVGLTPPQTSVTIDPNRIQQIQKNYSAEQLQQELMRRRGGQ